MLSRCPIHSSQHGWCEEKVWFVLSGFLALCPSVLVLWLGDNTDCGLPWSASHILLSRTAFVFVCCLPISRDEAKCANWKIQLLSKKTLSLPQKCLTAHRNYLFTPFEENPTLYRTGDLPLCKYKLMEFIIADPFRSHRFSICSFSTKAEMVAAGLSAPSMKWDRSALKSASESDTLALAMRNCLVKYLTIRSAWLIAASTAKGYCTFSKCSNETFYCRRFKLAGWLTDWLTDWLSSTEQSGHLTN